MSITYNGYKVKVFIKGRQVKTIKLNGRDPIQVVSAIRTLYITKGVL